MSNDQLHTKTRTERQVDADTTEIVTESYTDKPNSYKREISKTIKTSQNNLLKDVVTCLEHLSRKETKTLTIVITTDRYYQPSLIVKTWTEQHDYYK